MNLLKSMLPIIAVILLSNLLILSVAKDSANFKEGLKQHLLAKK